MLLPEELLELVFGRLVTTHAVALCRCRAVCHWYLRCADKPQWTRAALQKVYDTGQLSFRFVVPAQPPGWPADKPERFESDVLVAGQTSRGPLKWKIILYPRGNKVPGWEDPGWMAAYVKPMETPLHNVVVTLSFDCDDGEHMVTTTRFCSNPDWGFRKWRREDGVITWSVLRTVDVSVKLSLFSALCACET